MSENENSSRALPQPIDKWNLIQWRKVIQRVNRLQRRIAKAVKEKQWLKAGYIDHKTWFSTESGTPQGGIISPTIANMVLDGLEKEINRKVCPVQYRNGRWHNPMKVHFVRYADDFVVTCDNRDYLEKEIKPLVGNFLAQRGLELSREKSRITHISEGFDFLGFNIRKYNGKCLTKPKKDSVKSIYSSIRE